MISETVKKIDSLLRSKLSPLHLEILDESGQHVGHAGALSGGGHYRLILVSAAFEGKTLIEQHRMVNEALRELFKKEIHALALETFSPSQWKGSHV
jgi:BolA protein